MSLNDEERRTVVRLQLEKAHATFSQIPILCEAGFWDNVANRLYYSLFMLSLPCLSMMATMSVHIEELWVLSDSTTLPKASFP